MTGGLAVTSAMRAARGHGGIASSSGDWDAGDHNERITPMANRSAVQTLFNYGE